MSDTPALPDALDLAALIASRVCHDVISPVGAINNGIELLDDQKDEETQRIAMDLIRKSARQAAAKLKFSRIAFGAAGSAGSEIDTGDAADVARGFAESDKVTFLWEGPRWLLPKNRVKLALNLVMIGLSTIPRGGTLTVTLSGESTAPHITLRSHGMNARIPPAIPDLLAGILHEGPVDQHAIQPYYAGLIARAAGMSVAMRMDGEDVVIEALPAA